jgi:hypothetical protein
MLKINKTQSSVIKKDLGEIGRLVQVAFCIGSYMKGETVSDHLTQVCRVPTSFGRAGMRKLTAFYTSLVSSFVVLVI